MPVKFIWNRSDVFQIDANVGENDIPSFDYLLSPRRRRVQRNSPCIDDSLVLVIDCAKIDVSKRFTVAGRPLLRNRKTDFAQIDLNPPFWKFSAHAANASLKSSSNPFSSAPNNFRAATTPPQALNG